MMTHIPLPQNHYTWCFGMFVSSLSHMHTGPCSHAAFQPSQVLHPVRWPYRHREICISFIPRSRHCTDASLTVLAGRCLGGCAVPAQALCRCHPAVTGLSDRTFCNALCCTIWEPLATYSYEPLRWGSCDWVNTLLILFSFKSFEMSNGFIDLS